jgi:tripartite-type tricarboxylate transporter receptor subunit TctC
MVRDQRARLCPSRLPIRHGRAFAGLIGGLRNALLLAIGMSSLAPAVSAADPLCGGRTIRLINPFPPGGPSDLLARAFAETFQSGLQQVAVVENRPGAGGNLGTEAVARSAPDGCTLLVGIDTTLTINPAIYPVMSFRVDELRPLMVIASSGLLVAVHPGTGVRSLAELLARGRQAGLTFSSGGNGSPGHLAVSMLVDASGIRVTHVPYKGNTPAVTALVAGEVDAGTLATPGLLPFVRPGRVVPLAVTSPRRSGLLPEVPTSAEMGMSDLALEVLYVAMAPAGTPAAIVDRLRQLMVEALSPGPVRARLAQLDLVLEQQVGLEASQRLERQRERYRALIQRTGMRAD